MQGENNTKVFDHTLDGARERTIIIPLFCICFSEESPFKRRLHKWYNALKQYIHTCVYASGI